MNRQQSDRLQWIVAEDLVREILSAIRDLEGFIAVARIIEAPEPTHDGKGEFGRWAGIPADCEARPLDVGPGLEPPLRERKARAWRQFRTRARGHRAKS